MRDALPLPLLAESPSVNLPHALAEASFMLTALAGHIQRWFATTDFPLLGMQLGGALIAGGAVYAGLSIGLRVIGRKLSASSGAMAAPNPLLRSLGQIIVRTSRLFVLIAAIAAAAFLLPLPASLWTAIHSLFVVAFVLQAAIWANVILMEWLEGIGGASSTDYRALSNARAIIGTLTRATLWSVAALLVLDNLGFNVTTLVAGLGIGGIAIGLAAQKIIGDLFASLAIVLDKPFEYGDFIVAGAQMGTVERIGLKTTRLRSPTGEQIVIANSDLLESRIQNLKRMADRRVVFTIGIINGTPPEKLKRVPAIIADAVKAQKDARFERSHLIGFGDAALRFESSYVVGSADQIVYLDCQQAILLDIYRGCAKEGIALAVAIPAGLPPMTARASLSADGPAAAPAQGSAS